MFDFEGLHTVKVDGAGARKILEAHLKSGMKCIIFIQSWLARDVWHVLLTEGTDLKKTWSEKLWTTADRELLDTLLESMAKMRGCPSMFVHKQFVKSRMLTTYLTDNPTMDGEWVVGVGPEGFEILALAGCKFEILPPE